MVPRGTVQFSEVSVNESTGTVTLRARSPIPALMAMRDAHGERLYTAYGFKDAFNPSYIFADAGSTNRRSATTG